MNKKAHWITQTAVLLAMLVAVQGVTSGLGNQFVTGTLVNLILIVAVSLGGMSSGLTIAFVSPFFASLFGIGPKAWQIVLCVAIANAILVLIWQLIAGKKNQFTFSIVATVVAAIAKFGFLYLSVVQFVVPVVIGAPEPQATVMSAAFSFPQLITALAGGVIAAIIIPLLKKALGNLPLASH